MSKLYETIKTDLDAKQRSFTWLAEKIGMSRQGLKASIFNNTIRMDMVKNISGVLNIPIYDLLSQIFEELGAILENDPNGQLQLDELRKINQELESQIKEDAKQIQLLKDEQLKDKKIIVDFLLGHGVSKNQIMNRREDQWLKYDTDFNDIESMLKELVKSKMFPKEKFLNYLDKIIEEAKSQK